MKKNCNFSKNLLILLLLFNLIKAQKITIKEDQRNIGNGKNSCYVITIPEVKAKEVASAWKKLTKNYDAKVKGDDEQFADNAIIKNISENPIDVYSKFEESEEGTIMIVAFDLGGAYLNKKDHFKQYKEAYDFLHKFAKEQAMESISEQIKEQEKVIKNIENKINDKTAKISNLENDIKKWEISIEKAKNDIQELKKEIENLKLELSKENETLKRINEKKKNID